MAKAPTEYEQNVARRRALLCDRCGHLWRKHANNTCIDPECDCHERPPVATAA